MHDSVPADKWVVVARRLIALAKQYDDQEPSPRSETMADVIAVACATADDVHEARAARAAAATHRANAA